MLNTKTSTRIFSPELENGQRIQADSGRHLTLKKKRRPVAGCDENKIETVLNEKFLSEKGWHLSIGTLKGHFFTTVIMEDILLWHIDGSNVLSNKIRSKINIIPLITGKISLELLEINEIEAALKENSIINAGVGKSFELVYPEFPVLLHSRHSALLLASANIMQGQH